MVTSKLCIIGTGAAGLLTLFCLSFTKIPAEEIICIDPYHDGGNLQRKWCCIESNTVWDQMLQILRTKQISLESLPHPWRSLDPTKPALLRNYIQLLRHIVKPYYSRCECLYGRVSKIEEQSGKIRILYGKQETVETKLCILTTGCEAKQFSYPIPTIPLDVALNMDRLKSYIEPNQIVSVFGTAHSGTLILSNLHKLKANTHAFYKGEKAFSFARDGEYDGIKQESETIANEILSGTYTQTSLHSFTNTAELIRWTRRSDWVIYACGFERTDLTLSLTYDGQTGRIQELPNTWGFGIAFPNRASDGVHWDVSIPSFFEHIEKQIPTIVESFYA
jgi:hypothetical protein